MIKKPNFKLLFASIIFLIGICFLFFVINSKVLAAEDNLLIETTGYSVLSQDYYVFGGYYSGNVNKKELTTYFEFKKNDSNFDDPKGRERTIGVDIDHAHIPDCNCNDFYIGPELSISSTYYFRAVGYFGSYREIDTKPDSEKIYGKVLSLTTSSPFFWGVRPPFIVRTDGYALAYPAGCTLLETLGGSSCAIAEPLVCTAIQKKDGNVCVINTDKIDITKPPILNFSATPASILYDSESNLSWSSTYAAACITNGSWSGTRSVLSTPSSESTGKLTESKSYTLTCKMTPWGNVTKTVTVTVGPKPIVIVDTNHSGNPDGTGASGDYSGTNPNDVASNLIPCGTERYPKDTKVDGKDVGLQVKNPCGFNDLLTMINKVINYVLVVLIIPIAAILFTYAGFMLVTSGGEVGKKKKALSVFWNVGLGLVIMVAAWLIVNTVLSIVGFDGSWIGF